MGQQEEEASTEIGAVDASAKREPQWQVWASRPKIKLKEAVCLALGIFPSERAINALRKQKDPRVAALQTHVNTAVQWLGEHPKLMPLTKVRKRKSETTVSLADFVVWVKESRPFVGVESPRQFLNLTPPVLPKVGGAGAGPLDEPATVLAVQSKPVEQPSVVPARNAKAAATNRDNKLLLTLLGLAVSHYEY